MHRVCLLTGCVLVLAGCVDDGSARSRDDDDTDLGGAIDGEVAPDASLPDAPSAPHDAAPPPLDAGQVSPDGEPPRSCEVDGDCEPGARCEAGGVCSAPECRADGDCGGPVRACREGQCRDRCFGPNTCFRGGTCEDGVCAPPECEADGDCEGEDRLCREGRCLDAEPCGGPEDCGPDARCVEANCEPLPACVGDRHCAAAEICQDGICRPQPPCESAADCGEADCVGGRCVPFVCRGDVDCPGQICAGGECLDPPAVEVAVVVILNRPRSLAPNQQVQLRAVGLDLRGDIVAVRGFTWASSEPDTVVVDADSGLARAAAPGRAELTAALGEVASEPLAIEVVEPAPEGAWRVRITSALTGEALPGAVVLLGEQRQATGPEGVARFDGVAAPATLSVFAEGHDFLTIVALERTDVHLPLSPRSDDARVAGFTGRLSFDQITSEGGVEIGLAGASIGGGLTHLSMERLLGELFNVDLQIPVVGQITFPLPGGLTLAAEVPVLGQVQVKDEYRVIAQPGFQLGWSLAGRIAVNEVIGLFRGGGGVDVGQVLTLVLPFFDRFQHGLRVAEALVALPRLPDAGDVDNDGDVQERLPDYERFPVLNMTPSRAQALRLSVTVPELPELGEGTPVALLFAGVEVETVGFVPLGVSSSDVAAEVPMRMAAPYGGLEVGEPVLLAMAGAFGGAGALPRDISVLLGRYPRRVPADVEFAGPFLPPPGGVEWDPALRRLTGGLLEQASLHRAVFQGGAGRWTVLFPAGEAIDLAVPFPPEGMADLAGAGEVRLEAIQLAEPITLEALLGEGGPGDLGDLDRHTTAFSRTLP